MLKLSVENKRLEGDGERGKHFHEQAGWFEKATERFEFMLVYIYGFPPIKRLYK
jgi:hypothetical protein